MIETLTPSPTSPAPSIIAPAPTTTWEAIARELEAIYSPPTYSAGTRRWLLGGLKLLTWHAPTPATISPIHIVAIRTELAKRRRRGQAIKAVSVNTQLRACSSVCGYLLRRGILAANPFDVATLFLPEDEETPDTWAPSLEQLRRVLDQADLELVAPITQRRGSTSWRNARWRARRTRALIWLIASTGLRAAEALGMLTEDIDLDRKLAYVRANVRRRLKTKKSESPVPLTDECLAVLEPWIEEVRDTGFLFPGSRRSGPWLLGSAKWRPCVMVKGVGERAGVPGLTLKCLRHAFATHASIWGLTSEQVRDVLRHTNLRTQRGYKHVDVDNLHAIASRVKLRVVS